MKKQNKLLAIGIGATIGISIATAFVANSNSTNIVENKVTNHVLTRDNNRSSSLVSVIPETVNTTNYITSDDFYDIKKLQTGEIIVSNTELTDITQRYWRGWFGNNILKVSNDFPTVYNDFLKLKYSGNRTYNWKENVEGASQPLTGVVYQGTTNFSSADFINITGVTSAPTDNYKPIDVGNKEITVDDRDHQFGGKLTSNTKIYYNFINQNNTLSCNILAYFDLTTTQGREWSNKVGGEDTSTGFSFQIYYPSTNRMQNWIVNNIRNIKFVCSDAEQFLQLSFSDRCRMIEDAINNYFKFNYKDGFLKTNKVFWQDNFRIKVNWDGLHYNVSVPYYNQAPLSFSLLPDAVVFAPASDPTMNITLSADLSKTYVTKEMIFNNQDAIKNGILNEFKKENPFIQNPEIKSFSITNIDPLTGVATFNVTTNGYVNSDGVLQPNKNFNFSTEINGFKKVTPTIEYPNIDASSITTSGVDVSTISPNTNQQLDNVIKSQIIDELPINSKVEVQKMNISKNGEIKIKISTDKYFGSDGFVIENPFNIFFTVKGFNKTTPTTNFTINSSLKDIELDNNYISKNKSNIIDMIKNSNEYKNLPANANPEIVIKSYDKYTGTITTEIRVSSYYDNNGNLVEKPMTITTKINGFKNVPRLLPWQIALIVLASIILLILIILLIVWIVKKIRRDDLVISNRINRRLRSRKYRW